MKVKILKTFHRSQTYYVGQVVEMDDEEAKELLKDRRKLIETVKKKKEDK